MNIHPRYLPKNYKLLPFPGVKSIILKLPHQIADSIIDLKDRNAIEETLKNPEAFSNHFQSILKQLLTEELPIYYDDSSVALYSTMSCFLNTYFDEKLHIYLTNIVYSKVIKFLDSGEDEIYF